MKNETTNRLDRRTLFKTAAAAAGGTLAAIGTGCSSGTSTAAASPAIIVASDRNAVVETTAGRVRGFTRNGIHTFKGIPYAAATAGAARFMPPAKPVPWTGLRSALHYGPVCPQAPRTGWANDENAFFFNWDDGQPGEDCLRINIWTPGVNDREKRPVMVWLHGGGYSSGSGQEHPGYHGENLSRRGNVVVASLNHRLNVFGHLDLSEYGAQYADSANAGILDIVAALEWVRDNIANFGGDPGNVLIFGQSGGGGKVSTLMAMPAAKGLFHKAVVMSGSTLTQAVPEDSRKLAAAVLAELKLSKAQAQKLQDVPAATLVEASSAALRKLTPPMPGGMAFGMPRGRRIGWSPVVDGRSLPAHPFDPSAPSISAEIPMMIGTTLNEMSPSAFDASLESMTEDELRKRAEARYGEKTGSVIDACRTVYPNAKPVEVLSIISSVRLNAVTQAARKAAQGAAPAYLYQFCWHTPVLDGRPRAIHCADIAFAFYNTDVSASMTGGTAEARDLGAKVADAFLNFARKGDPNNPSLPLWRVFDPEKAPTMCFDRVCEGKDNHDGVLRRAVREALG
jgi:para-nitrobenzyl esterase